MAEAGRDRHTQCINILSGLSGDPVEFVPQYALSDAIRPPRAPARHDYLHLDRLLGDMTPPSATVAADAHSFPVARVRRWQSATFNVASYMSRLTRDFLLRGGRMTRRDFPDRAAILALPEQTIVNCTGYGARSLWDDQGLLPVRGQINWLDAAVGRALRALLSQHLCAFPARRRQSFSIWAKIMTGAWAMKAKWRTGKKPTVH